MMSTAERRAHKIFMDYHLNEEDLEVKRNLMILLLKTDSFVSVDKMNKQSYSMSHEDISARLAEAEADILSGNSMACEDVHRDIEAKCPWL